MFLPVLPITDALQECRRRRFLTSCPTNLLILVMLLNKSFSPHTSENFFLFLERCSCTYFENLISLDIGKNLQGERVNRPPSFLIDWVRSGVWMTKPMDYRPSNLNEGINERNLKCMGKMWAARNPDFFLFTVYSVWIFVFKSRNPDWNLFVLKAPLWPFLDLFVHLSIHRQIHQFYFSHFFSFSIELTWRSFIIPIIHHCMF